MEIDKFDLSPPTKIKPILDKLDIIGKKATLRCGISHDIDFCNRTVRVNRHESKYRQRLSLVRSVALLELDKNTTGIKEYDVLYRRCDRDDKYSREANLIAADILSPWGEVYKELSKTKHLSLDEKIKNLSETFELSETFFKIRLQIT